MEARKPSNQTADARTADGRLKSAKPRRVRLRSLAARAVCGLLNVAALLTLPGQVQAQTTIWSSTPTIRDHQDPPLAGLARPPPANRPPWPRSEPAAFIRWRRSSEAMRNSSSVCSPWRTA